MKLKVALAVAALLGAGAAQAQQSCDTGNGPVSNGVDFTKKADDVIVVNWTAPEFLADADCTPINSSPDFALTQYDVYFSIGDPVQVGEVPIGTVNANTTDYTINLSVLGGLFPGAKVYVAVTSSNQFGESALSNQPRGVIGGPAQRATSDAN